MVQSNGLPHARKQDGNQLDHGTRAPASEGSLGNDMHILRCSRSFRFQVVDSCHFERMKSKKKGSVEVLPAFSDETPRTKGQSSHRKEREHNVRSHHLNHLDRSPFTAHRRR